MHIAILTTGSRGDVQPYVALGVGLQAAGHSVTIVTGASFARFIIEYGLQHAPLEPDLMALLDTPEGRAAIAGRNPLGAMKKVRPLLRTMLDQCWAATADADMLVYNPKALAGYHIAEKRGLPAVMAHPVPTFSPTAAFAVPAISLPTMGGTLNRLSYPLFLRAATASVRGIVNAWRREVLGLAPGAQRVPARRTAGADPVRVQPSDRTAARRLAAVHHHDRRMVLARTRLAAARRPGGVPPRWTTAGVHRLWQHDRAPPCPTHDAGADGVAADEPTRGAGDGCGGDSANHCAT
jgi:UDP:flavonoid glycosyltransferase YjiC (YdhE family)